MKTLATALVLSASLLAAAGANAASFNNNGNYEPPFDGVYGQVDNGPSRAQVVADLQQAKAQGQLDQFSRGEGDRPFEGVYGTPNTGKTRAQVKQELAQYKAAHPNEVIEH